MARWIPEIENNLPKIENPEVEKALRTARIMYGNGINMGVAISKAAKIYKVPTYVVNRENTKIARMYNAYDKEHGIVHEAKKKQGSSKNKTSTGGYTTRASQ